MVHFHILWCNLMVMYMPHRHWKQVNDILDRLFWVHLPLQRRYPQGTHLNTIYSTNWERVWRRGVPSPMHTVMQPQAGQYSVVSGIAWWEVQNKWFDWPRLGILMVCTTRSQKALLLKELCEWLSTQKVQMPRRNLSCAAFDCLNTWESQSIPKWDAGESRCAWLGRELR